MVGAYSANSNSSALSYLPYRYKNRKALDFAKHEYSKIPHESQLLFGSSMNMHGKGCGHSTLSSLDYFFLVPLATFFDDYIPLILFRLIRMDGRRLVRCAERSCSCCGMREGSGGIVMSGLASRGKRGLILDGNDGVCCLLSGSYYT